jgi:hypothetical protein
MDGDEIDFDAIIEEFDSKRRAEKSPIRAGAKLKSPKFKFHQDIMSNI